MKLCFIKAIFLLFFVFILLFWGVFFCLVFFLIVFLFSLKRVTQSKLTAFERGFSGIKGLQSSFSIHFFLVILVFIIFDLEVVFFLGFLLGGALNFFSLFCFWWFVIGGLYLEWSFGKLSWISLAFSTILVHLSAKEVVLAVYWLVIFYSS